MTLIIENGSAASSSANSYYSVASTSAYLNSRGFTAWANASTVTKETSLINAMYYMEVLPWKGQKSLSTDPLVWPRRGMLDRDGYVIYSDEIPIQIKQGQAQIAYRYYLGTPPFTDIASGDGYVTREKIGPVEISYSMGYSTSYKFPEIDALLSPFLDGSLSVLVERA